MTDTEVRAFPSIFLIPAYGYVDLGPQSPWQDYGYQEKDPNLPLARNASDGNYWVAFYHHGIATNGRYGVSLTQWPSTGLAKGTYAFAGFQVGVYRLQVPYTQDLFCQMYANGKKWDDPVNLTWAAPFNAWQDVGQPMGLGPLVIDASGKFPLNGPDGMSFAVELNIYHSTTAAKDTIKGYITNARLTIYLSFAPPVPSVSAPTGTITTNRPTVLWGFSSPDGLACSHFQVRVFAESVAAAGGFDPEVSPPAYDSGQRPYTAGDPKSFTLPASLDSGQWRAYVKVWQQSVGGYPAPVDFTQPSVATPYTAFTISTTAPPRDPPTIPTNVVANLTDALRLRLRNAHVPTFQARLFWWDGSASWPLELLGGAVTLDARAKLRGRATLTVTDHELVPAAPAPLSFSTPLHPYGSYVHLARGVAGTLVSLGVYRIESVKVEQRGQGQPVVNLDCLDYEAHLQDARFLQGQSRQSWATGTAVPNLVTDVAKAIISEGGLAYRMPGTASDRVSANYVNERGNDRVDALRSLAASLGWITYLTHDGAVYFGPPPDLATAPMAVLVEGDNAIVLSKSFELSRKDVYDVAAVVNDDANVSGYAYDANPVSPIKRSGVNPSIPTFGSGGFTPAGKPYFLASPVVVTVGAAQAAAVTVLKTNALPADRVAVACVCVPDVRPGDVVVLRRIGSDTDELWWVETVTVPLDVTSQQTLVLVGPPSYVQAVVA